VRKGQIPWLCREHSGKFIQKVREIQKAEGSGKICDQLLRRPYNFWIHNAILFLIHASFNHCFPFCILRVTRSTFQSSWIYVRQMLHSFVVFSGLNHTIYFKCEIHIYARYMKFSVLLPERILILKLAHALNQMWEKKWILQLKLDWMWNIWLVTFCVKKYI